MLADKIYIMGGSIRDILMLRDLLVMRHVGTQRLGRLELLSMGGSDRDMLMLRHVVTRMHERLLSVGGRLGSDWWTPSTMALPHTPGTWLRIFLKIKNRITNGPSLHLD